MNQHLLNISNFLQQDKTLSGEEKDALLKSVKEADKELEIINFKLDRTEKVKRTTAILLEETIEELEQKRKAVEAQNRELEIESSLEKVRTVAMAMRKLDNMLDVCKTITQQLELLNVKDLRNVQTAIFDETKHVYINYEYYHLHNKTFITEVNYTRHPVQLTFANQMLKGDGSFFSTTLTGAELDEFIEHQKASPEFVDPFLYQAKSLSWYWYALGAIAFGVSVYSPMHEADQEIVKRFKNVFDFAYRRYIDVALAEAQAREAQIALALERVRARTMAMQKSDELAETAFVLFQQFEQLGEDPEQLGIGIFNEQEHVLELWTTINGKIREKAVTVSLDEPIVMHKFYAAWKEGQKTLIIDISGKELKQYNDYRNSLSNVKMEPSRLKDRRVISIVYFSKGALSLATSEPRPPETLQLLERFSNVFDLTYTRFLDLKKAEAQSKESRIQLALERVRARTMAMQKSEELPDTSLVLFQQLKELGEPAEQLSIGIINEAENIVEVTVTLHGQPLTHVFRHSIDEPRLMNKIYTGWKEQQKILVVDMQGEELQAYNKYRNELIGTETFTPNQHPGDRRVVHSAFFSKGMLALATNEPRPQESVQLLERFAKVFDSTYTRFLDLQKAEAQAREAQIEASLERVRSKAMSMQKSDDLANTVAIVFEELDKLNLGMLRCGIGILNKEKRCAQVWTTTVSENNTIVQVSGEESMDIHPLLCGAFEAWTKQEDHSYVLQGEDLNNYYKAVARENFKLPDSQSLVSGAEGIKQYYYNAVWSSGGLFAFRETAFPEEAKIVLRRFADVFDFTYTRFNDLKQAEAQAREAKVEVALERVRSRTLAMQKSDELAETAAVLFRQLISLGIAPNRLYICIVKDDHGDSEFWITDEDGSKVSSAFETNLNGNTTFKKMFTGWKKEKRTLVINMQGDELQEYFKFLTSIHVPFKGGLDQKRRVQDIAYFSKGFIGIASPDEQPEETILLLERFAAVFNLTYTRFNDLKIAEAHAVQAEEDLIKLQTEKKRAEDALTELRSTQAQLIQSEKMASLGELTAGIAHEIQNPLNFVNNFSEVSKELIDEMKEAIEKGDTADAKEIMNDVIQNLEKINHHGKRADAIVKGMLQHSRASSATKEPTDINKLADEYLRLAYHGLRAKDKTFNAALKTGYDETAGNINIIPQDIGRVILNLITNAFYAVDEKKKASLENPSFENLTSLYEPTVAVSTKKINNKVEVKVADNGNGIPAKILDKIFQPFFTTKPTGQGTGLGLSLAYDIVKAHGGELKVETKDNEGSTFTIQLPLNYR